MHDEPSLLRVEHDGLAARLACRSSIDWVRRGAYSAFALTISGGLSVKLAYDRWGPDHPRAFKGPPLFFYMALGVALACLAVATYSFARARREMRREDADYARFRALRQRLGLDP